MVNSSLAEIPSMAHY